MGGSTGSASSEGPVAWNDIAAQMASTSGGGSILDGSMVGSSFNEIRLGSGKQKRSPDVDENEDGESDAGGFFPSAAQASKSQVALFSGLAILKACV